MKRYRPRSRSRTRTPRQRSRGDHRRLRGRDRAEPGHRPRQVQLPEAQPPTQPPETATEVENPNATVYAVKLLNALFFIRGNGKIQLVLPWILPLKNS